MKKLLRLTLLSLSVCSFAVPVFASQTPIREEYRGMVDKSKGDDGFEFHSEGGGRGYVTVYFKDGTTKDVTCDTVANGTCYVR